MFFRMRIYMRILQRIRYRLAQKIARSNFAVQILSSLYLDGKPLFPPHSEKLIQSFLAIAQSHILAAS